MSEARSPVIVSRICEATLIPGGTKMLLHEGEEVYVTQSLGGTFTVTTMRGYLARVAGADADALGLEAPEEAPAAAAGSGAPADLEQVLEELKSVFDPEIPVNVVDLGLIYGCELSEAPGGGQRVEIKMSMTAPGCGMGDVLADDAKTAVAALPGVEEVDVELVWDPPWDLSRMSEAARLQLGMY
ncbi:MAG TPA: putative Fe-S cluster assembly protein SufT [Acidimicrobiales bacterium]|nr:putative Fe-S cluster assembly protein SufT [Acidimicrobiales bacterium]